MASLIQWHVSDRELEGDKRWVMWILEGTSSRQRIRDGEFAPSQDSGWQWEGPLAFHPWALSLSWGVTQNRTPPLHTAASKRAAATWSCDMLGGSLVPLKPGSFFRSGMWLGGGTRKWGAGNAISESVPLCGLHFAKVSFTGWVSCVWISGLGQ